MRRNTPAREQPSDARGFFQLYGDLFEKPIMIQVIRGTVMTRWAMTRPVYVSKRPKALKTMNQGTRNEIPGIIRQTRIPRRASDGHSGDPVGSGEAQHHSGPSEPKAIRTLFR